MKALCTFCAVLALHATLHAVEITVGSTTFDIPAPEGFAPVTKEMQPYANFSKSFAGPGNTLFAVFLSEEAIAVAEEGGMPDDTRKFVIQSPTSLLRRTATKTDFEEFKKVLKTQNEEFIKKAQKQASRAIEKTTDSLAKNFDIEVKVSSFQMIPMPAHEETDRSFAHAALIKYQFDNGAEFEVAVTLSLVHVKGKILTLYVFAENSALEWSKAAVKTWSDDIIAANPSMGAVASAEEKASRAFGKKGTSSDSIPYRIGYIVGFVGAFVGILCFIAVVIGGLVYVLYIFIKKKTNAKKKSRENSGDSGGGENKS